MSNWKMLHAVGSALYPDVERVPARITTVKNLTTGGMEEIRTDTRMIQTEEEYVQMEMENLVSARSPSHRLPVSLTEVVTRCPSKNFNIPEVWPQQLFKTNLYMGY
jgi:hypothetical protein